MAVKKGALSLHGVFVAFHARGIEDNVDHTLTHTHARLH
jgi:hypothetical protein